MDRTDINNDMEMPIVIDIGDSLMDQAPQEALVLSCEQVAECMADMEADLYCPIFQELFVDPVRATDGIAYEREAIQRWMALNPKNPTSPMTRKQLGSELTPDHGLRERADAHRVSMPVPLGEFLEQLHGEFHSLFDCQ